MPKDPICGMNVDESTNLKLDFNGETYYFCSEHCLKKFSQENKIDKCEVDACMSCGYKKSKWYKNKTFIVFILILFVVALSYKINILEPFRMSLFMYLKDIWWAILLGLILGGVIDYFIPREYISKILSKHKKRTIFYSVGLGFLMTTCSHGILALTVQLYKKGASVPAVVSFLLASPWANLPLTFMLIGFFGLKAFYIIFGAILIAIITGFIFQFLDKKNIIEKNKNTIDVDENFSILDDIKQRMKKYKFSKQELVQDIRGIFNGSIALADMIMWWILIGIILAGLIGAYVPQNIFQKYLGPSFLGMCMTLVMATVIEVCSEGSAPIAFEIFRQTGALGNSFVFLMAGVVTDYTEIGILWTNVGPRTAVLLPLITVPQVLLLGLIANLIL
jgi:uncharacterized protein